jgi:hypothetical protein
MGMNEKPQHATITLERTYRAPLERVFSEFADPVARARWSPRVVSSETLDEDGQRLAVSLNTLDLEATGESTNLKLTVQMVSLVGAGMIKGYESGHDSALENLARHLSGKF